MRPLLLCLALVLGFATFAAAQERPRVVAVNYPLQYLAERLVGDAVEVVFPVPEGVDPSFWRPAIADISMIQSADLILLNGAGFATWIDRVTLPRSRVVNTSAALEDQFIVTESITHSHGDGGEHSHASTANYLWLDPQLAVAQAEAIAAALVRRGVVSAEEIAPNRAALAEDLVALDRALGETLRAAKSVPLIATHPRYQYFARRYGLTITSLEWEAGVMPSDTALAELSALAADTGARVLIWEVAPPPDAIEAVAALGLSSVVMNTMVSGAPESGYVTSLSAAAEALADAVSQGPQN